MIFTLIVFLLVVVFMAFFIGKNLTNVCTLWLFKTYTELPVAVLVLIAFGAGIVFSLLLVMIHKFKKSLAASNVAEVEEKRPKKEKSIKREKTERKLNLLKKGKKSKAENTEQLSDIPENADN